MRSDGFPTLILVPVMLSLIDHAEDWLSRAFIYPAGQALGKAKRAEA